MKKLTLLSLSSLIFFSVACSNGGPVDAQREEAPLTQEQDDTAGVIEDQGVQNQEENEIIEDDTMLKEDGIINDGENDF